MAHFFSESLDQQINSAISYNDAKFLQILLGPEYCQLWEDWLAHCMLAFKLIGVTQILKYQLPMNIIAAQEQILCQNFPHAFRSLPTSEEVGTRNDAEAMRTRWTEAIQEYKCKSEEVKTVNKKLKKAELDVVEKYQNWRSMPEGMFDPVRNFMFSYDGSDVGAENENMKAISKALKNKCSLQPVLKLDFSDLYSEIYNEVCRSINNNYSLRLKEGELVYSLYEGSDSLVERMKKFTEDNDRLRSILGKISGKIVKGLTDKEFIDEVYNILIEKVFDDAEKNQDHPLSLELKSGKGGREEMKKKIKKFVKENKKTEILRKCMECVAIQSKPSLNMIIILLANGASLHSSFYFDNSIRETITVKEKFVKMGTPYRDLISKSIYTITKKAHEIVFDFPIFSDGVDLLSVVSRIPNENGQYIKNAENMMLFSKLGTEGEQQFMSLLKSCAKHIDKKESDSSIIDAIVEFFTRKPSEEQRQEALLKLYQCIEVGYVSIRSGCNKVILDYIAEIEQEAKSAKNPYLKKLYENFLCILSDNRDLPKSMFCERWKRYFSRLLTWSPKWDKIFRQSSNYTDVGEWAKTRNEEIVGLEKEADAAYIAEIEENTKKLERMKNQEVEKMREAEKKTELVLIIGKLFTVQTRNLGDLFEMVTNSQLEIVNAVLKYVLSHDVPPEPVLKAIMSEVRLNRDHVLNCGYVSHDLIELSLNNINTSGYVNT